MHNGSLRSVPRLCSGACGASVILSQLNGLELAAGQQAPSTLLAAGGETL